MQVQRAGELRCVHGIRRCCHFKPPNDLWNRYIEGEDCYSARKFILCIHLGLQGCVVSFMQASRPFEYAMKRQKRIFFDVHIKERWREGYQNLLTDIVRYFKRTRVDRSFNMFSVCDHAFRAEGVNIYKCSVVVIPRARRCSYTVTFQPMMDDVIMDNLKWNIVSTTCRMVRLRRGHRVILFDRFVGVEWAG